MDLTQLRREIDRIDSELVRLFCQRMDMAAKVADYKKEHNLPIAHPGREREVLQKVASIAGDEMGDYTRVLYSIIFELSRGYQRKRNDSISPLYRQIFESIENTPKCFPQSPAVACLGIEDAYSQIACQKIFENPCIQYFQHFEGVCNAIAQGMCQYGILPIETSAAGSVARVYDLMVRHNFYIVRTFRMKIDHNLLANPEATFTDIPVTNTAIAPQMVSESGQKDVAAISSCFCAELYSMNCLAASIQDMDKNQTRFICISKNLEIYPGSDKTSIMMILPHKPGSLYNVLARLYTLGINITKLESRPIPDREFEFMFYFDLDTSIYSEEYIQLMCELDDLCEEFKYLGSYTEVV